MTIRVLGTILAATLLAAPAATAADRYAAPGGSGPETTCPQSNPCSITNAADGPSVANGDVVLLAAGTYTLSSRLDVVHDIQLRPIDPAGPKPVLTSAAPPDVVDVRTSGAVLSDLEIRGTGNAAGLWLSGSTAERITATSVGQGACHVTASALLRDSTCLDTGGAPGAMFENSDSGLKTATLVNVTAVSSAAGASPYGLYAEASSPGAAVQLTARNVIAYSAEGPDVQAARGAGATSASIELSTSNYDNVATTGGATITPSGSPGNQVELPQFVNLAAGDLHQVPASGTIDAGSAAAPGLGALDIDRNPRIIGPAPDIGADEAPDDAAPETTLTKTPKRKVKSKKKRKKAKFAFESSEAGSTFTCSLDGKPAVPCASGRFAKKVRRGKHTFEVTAIDAAGNADPTPATYRWKLKRKR